MPLATQRSSGTAAASDKAEAEQSDAQQAERGRFRNHLLDLWIVSVSPVTAVLLPVVIVWLMTCRNTARRRTVWVRGNGRSPMPDRSGCR